jgi:hypothetical protein
LYNIKSEIVIIDMPNFLAQGIKSFLRAMVPLSRVISAITATGHFWANIHKSIDASVCPALVKTPPGLYDRGKTCPGRLKSAAILDGSDNAFIVAHLSKAEIPVVVDL